MKKLETIKEIAGALAKDLGRKYNPYLMKVHLNLINYSKV